MAETETDRADLGFVREDVGLAILGTIAAVVGLVVANSADPQSSTADIFGMVALGGLLLVGWKVIHLGYRLAFPKKR